MKKLTGISLFIFFCVVTAVLTAGLVFYQKNKDSQIGLVNQNTNTDIAKLVSSGAITLDLKEISKHSTNSDCWIVVNNKIYNISNYASSHPGGTGNILNSCGKEATQAFNTQGGGNGTHSSSANQMLSQFFIGNLNQNIDQKALDQTIQNIQSNPLPANKGYEDEDD